MNPLGHYLRAGLLWLTIGLITTTGLPTSVSADLETDIARLWILATDGAVRHRDLVAPSKDSLIAMGESAIPFLLPYLNTEDARERHAITDLFKGIGPVAVPPLLKVLGSGGEYHTLNILRAFIKIADSTATPRLGDFLGDTLASIRGRAAEAIGKCGGSMALSSLYRVLHDPAETVRKSAVVGLGRLAQTDATDSLIEALSDPWYGVRYTAAFGIVSLDSGHTAIRSLSRLEGRPLALMLHALGTQDVQRAAKAVWSYTEHADDAVRVEAAYALSRSLARRSDASRLKKLLDTETHRLVRYYHAQALIRIHE